MILFVTAILGTYLYASASSDLSYKAWGVENYYLTFSIVSVLLFILVLVLQKIDKTWDPLQLARKLKASDDTSIAPLFKRMFELLLVVLLF